MSAPREIQEALGEARLRLLVQAGSRAYGLQIEESDEDFIGVFSVPLRRFLSLGGLENDTLVGRAPDFTLHEIGKFCRLAIKGNPAVLEALWTPEPLVADAIGRELVELRSAFLHRASLEVYIDYAAAQMKKIVRGKPLHSKGGAYNGKYGAHLVRLLHAGIHLAERGEVQVGVSADLAATLLRIRRQEISMGAVLDMARPLLEQLKRLSKANPLPEAPDAARIEELVVRARMQNG